MTLKTMALILGLGLAGVPAAFAQDDDRDTERDGRKEFREKHREGCDGRCEGKCREEFRKKREEEIKKWRENHKGKRCGETKRPEPDRGRGHENNRRAKDPQPTRPGGCKCPPGGKR